MAGHQFIPIFEADLPEVAAFLFEQQTITSREDWTQARPSGDDLRWLLDNPDLPPGAAMGETLRTADGKILGMILALPRMYRLGDRKLLGMAAGNFFVDASARMQGFFLLKRFLASSGPDFWYANSCNRQSGPLWSKLGGVLVAESDVEYLFPFRLGPLLEEIAIRKNWPAPLRKTLKRAGPLASLIAAPRRRRNPFRVEYCADLDRLADIAERDRNPRFLQADRSPAYLRWVYSSVPPTEGAEGASLTLHRFQDTTGREGWFGLSFVPRGRDDQIRSARLYDVVWPHEHYAFAEILPAIVEVAAQRTDLLSIRGRIGLGLSDRIAGLRRRTLLAPEGFIVSKTPPSSELAALADFPFADRY
jgi:hypothetical protein